MGSQGSSRSRSGSSPLARGTQVQKFRERWLRRLIPARAGNTRAVAPGRAPGTAHPRSRGEHSELLWLLGQDCGSSPLARGTRGACGASGTLSRLIPARAGNTAMFHVFMMGFPAHPRSRGEHMSPRSKAAASSGSSPLARGTPLFSRQKLRRFRLIPARAGNTDLVVWLMVFQAAHPRSRGEHNRSGLSANILSGSSPLARGTR